jgi:hypothetical protein
VSFPSAAMQSAMQRRQASDDAAAELAAAQRKDREEREAAVAERWATLLRYMRDSAVVLCVVVLTFLIYFIYSRCCGDASGRGTDGADANQEEARRAAATATELTNARLLQELANATRFNDGLVRVVLGAGFIVLVALGWCLWRWRRRVAATKTAAEKAKAEQETAAAADKEKAEEEAATKAKKAEEEAAAKAEAEAAAKAEAEAEAKEAEATVKALADAAREQEEVRR